MADEARARAASNDVFGDDEKLRVSSHGRASLSVVDPVYRSSIRCTAMGSVRSLIVFAAASVLSTVVGCKPAVDASGGGESARPTHNDNVYPLYDMEMAELARVKGQVSGNVQQLFLVNKTRERFSFGKPCERFSAVYHWVESRQVHTYDFHDQTDVTAHLPFHTGINFKAYFDRGQIVRIRVASRGSWMLDTSKGIPQSCASEATHFVKTMVMGAFMVTTMARTSGGASAGVASANLAEFDASKESKTSFEAGEVFECDQGDAKERPPEKCREPVEIMIAPITDATVIDDPWAKPGTGEARPTADTSPQPESTCYQAAKYTGDPQKDIVEIGAACKRFGLEPIGQPIVQRSLSEDQGWQRQFEVELQAGACYRFFAVGDTGVKDMDIGIKDSGGQQIAVDGQHGPIAVIDSDGPFCAKKTETVIVLAKVEKGTGRYAFWQFKKVR
jgi:hypothetical protein